MSEMIEALPTLHRWLCGERIGPLPVRGADLAPPKLSFEFFPPRTEALEQQLWRCIRKLEPLSQVQSQDEAAALLNAVAQLPAEQRSAFLLQAEGELSVEEIADATGSNFETVKSRLRYARAKLRQLLWEYA